MLRSKPLSESGNHYREAKILADSYHLRSVIKTYIQPSLPSFCLAWHAKAHSDRPRL